MNPVAVKPGFYPPRRTATIGMWLFLVALFMLFGSSMIAYVWVRLTGLHRAPAGSLHLPKLLWLSTAMIIGVSLTFPRALAAVRRERQAAFRGWLLATLALAAMFIVIQTPAMSKLLATHQGYLAEYRQQMAAHHDASPAPPMRLYGVVFILVLLHAAHVFGGVVCLGVVAVKSFRGAYDHENYAGVRHAALYWHFLDIVWVVMFSTFLLLG